MTLRTYFDAMKTDILNESNSLSEPNMRGGEKQPVRSTKDITGSPHQIACGEGDIPQGGVFGDGGRWWIKR